MTGDPLRLLDDPTTGAALRHDLGVALRPAGSLHPLSGAAYDVEAGLARFESTLASNLARGTGAASTGGVSGGLAVGALLLAGGLAVLGWQLAGPMAPAPEPARLAAGAGWSQPQVVPSVPPVVVPERAPVAAPVAGAKNEVTIASEAGASTPRPARTRKPAARGIRSGAGVAGADYLREARELNAARGLLGKDAARALALAEAGAAEFRAGTFVPEWEGVAVLALFELGRTDEARSRGEAYLRRHASGTYAPRIRQALGHAP